MVNEDKIEETAEGWELPLFKLLRIAGFEYCRVNQLFIPQEAE